jgi:hypothetical protein
MHSHSFMLIHVWWLWGIIRGAHDESTCLVFCKCLESILDLTSPQLAQLCCAWALAHVGEYARIVRTLVSSTLAAPSYEITGVFHLFHSLVEVDHPPFVDDFHPEMEVTLDWEAFVFALAQLPHLFFDGPLGMVYELLWDCFFLNDLASGFDLFFDVGTLFEVMFHLQYHVCFLHLDF